MSKSGSSHVLETPAEATKRQKIEYVKQIIRANANEYTIKNTTEFRDYNHFEEDIDNIANDLLDKMPFFYATSITQEELKDKIDVYFLHYTPRNKGGSKKSKKYRKKSRKSKKSRKYKKSRNKRR